MVSPVRLGENVALVPLVYEALRVMACPAVIAVVLAVKVHVGFPGSVHVFVPVPRPVQLVLQWPAVPLRAPSSQTSFCQVDCAFHATNPAD